MREEEEEERPLNLDLQIRKLQQTKVPQVSNPR